MNSPSSAIAGRIWLGKRTISSYGFA